MTDEERRAYNRIKAKKYRDAHPDRAKASNKKWRAAHKTIVTKWKRESSRRHPETQRARAARWRERHPEVNRAKSNRWYARHADHAKSLGRHKRRRLKNFSLTEQVLYEKFYEFTQTLKGKKP